MSFTKTVTTKDGVEKNIVADSQEDLDAAVKAAKSETSPTYPNIDRPVKKGHDLVNVEEDGSVELVDGTGEHNSPREAVRDDGSPEGDTLVPGLPNSVAKDVPERITVGEPHSADVREQVGEEKVRKAEEKQAKK